MYVMCVYADFVQRVLDISTYIVFFVLFVAFERRVGMATIYSHAAQQRCH